MWTPLESTFVTTKTKLLCKCKCGGEHLVRPREIIEGKSLCCKSCSSKLKMLKVPKEKRVEIARRASLKAAELAREKRMSHPYRVKYGEHYDKLLNKASNIKQRCTNPNAIGFSNYGGRGIEFRFDNPSSFARWILDSLGPQPEDKQSLDRIDNNAHYEKGNLRWADYSEQARNKRVYKRTNNGERIRTLQQLRPDLTYETLRQWITQGATDLEILNRSKYERTSI